MTWSQQLVINWMEFAFAGMIILGVTKLVVHRLRQPIDRVNLILMSVLASVLVPLLLSSLNTPSLRLGLFSINGDQLVRVDPRSHLSQPQQHSEAADDSTAKTEQQINLETVESIGSGTMSRSEAILVVDGEREAVLPAFSIWSVNGWMKGTPSTWSIVAAILLATQGLVVSWCFIQWIIGTIRLRYILNRAVNADESILHSWKEVPGRSDDSVRLLVSNDVSTPMLLGCWNPVILLPVSIAAGDPSSLRFCLAHEWSHVRCRDLIKWQAINLCQLAFWYQPLFWILRRELRICQDQVADDHATGATKGQLARIEYSELLLSIAKEASNPSIAGGMAFYDRSSQLTRRIKMLLSDRESLRNRSTQVFCWFSGLSLLILAVVISSVRLSTVRAQENALDKSALINVGENGPTANTTGKDNNAKIVRGQVVDAVGKPISKAKLWLPLQWKPRRTVEATTDDAGRFQLNCPNGWISSTFSGSSWTLWAYAPGHSIQSQSVYDVVRGKSDREYTIQLPPASSTRFKILTPTGEPLSNVLVKPRNYETSVGYEVVPEEMQPSIVARTNVNGIVTLQEIQSGPLFSIEMLHEEYGRQIIRVSKNKEDVREIRLQPTASIRGRMTSEDLDWVRNVELVFATDSRDETKIPQGLAEVVTDDEGKFQVPIFASGGPLRTYVRIDKALPVRPVINDNVFLTAGETIDLEIPLVKAPRVRGRVVVKSTGRPVAKAEISLGYGGFRQNDQVVTDENGEYEGRVLPGGVRVHILSLPDGLEQLGAPWAEPYQVPTNVEQFELPTIEVVGSNEMQGLLIGADDEPVPNTQVLAVKENRRYGFGKSDANGRFKMQVPDGVDLQFEVYLEDEGARPVQVVRQDPLLIKYPGDTVEKEMESARAIKPDVILAGRILMAGEPVVGVSVKLKRGVPVSLGSKHKTSIRYGTISETKTDANGNYRLTGLKAGDGYQIEIDPPTRAVDPRWYHQSPYMQNLSDNAKGEIALPDVNLHKLTQSIAGVVVDPEGKPVKDASVSVQLRTGEHLALLTPAGPPPWTETDHQGRFHLKELPEEPLSIMAYFADPKGGRIRFPAQLHVESNQKDIRVVLDPSLREAEER